jgi:site-specific DNA-methyltransferase (adenine-specific)
MTSTADASIHTCRKPTKEWTRLILAHTLPGQTILDPFMGSGTTGEICMKHGRNFIGIELSPIYFAEAEQRIKNAAGDFVVTDKEKANGKMSLFDWAAS